MIKDSKYYIRAGSSSFPAPDSFLRSLFGKEPQPDVFMFFSSTPVQVDDRGKITIKVGITLHNRGECVAKNVNGYILLGGLGMSVEINRNFAADFSFYSDKISGLKIGFVAKSSFIFGIEQSVQPLELIIELCKPITENGLQIYTLISADNQMSYRADRIISHDELELAYDSYMADPTFNLIQAILGNK